MSDRSRLSARGLGASMRPPRRRRWWRWILAGLVALVVVVAGVAVLSVKLAPSAPPLGLPAGTVSAPAGPLDGTWQVAAGSVAGFRLEQTALGISSYIGGTTTGITGTMVLSGAEVTSATLRIRLTAIKVSGKVQPQLAASLRAGQHPVATFTLTGPVRLSPALASGGTVTITAAGQLALNGTSKPVAVTLSARRAGMELQTAGAIAVSLSRWHIAQPQGFGFLGSLSSHGAAEFSLILRRR